MYMHTHNNLFRHFPPNTDVLKIIYTSLKKKKKKLGKRGILLFYSRFLDESGHCFLFAEVMCCKYYAAMVAAKLLVSLPYYTENKLRLGNIIINTRSVSPV